jgi:hypothetical protein
MNTTSSSYGLSTQQNQLYKIVEEYNDIFTSLGGVPLHYQVKHSIELIPSASLPNGLKGNKNSNS